MGLFEPRTETSVVLQRINGNNGLIVIIKRILVHGNLTLNLGYSDTIQTDERNGKAVPDFFLELSKDALQSTYKNALAATTTNHLTEEDAHLDCLTETYAICDKQTRTRQFHCFQGGLHLIFSDIIGSSLSNSNLMREKGVTSYCCFNKKSCLTPFWVFVGHQQSIGRADNLNICIYACVKNEMMVFDQLTDTRGV